MKQGRILKTLVMGRCSALHQHLVLVKIVEERISEMSDLSGIDLFSDVVVHREGEEDLVIPSV